MKIAFIALHIVISHTDTATKTYVHVYTHVRTSVRVMQWEWLVSAGIDYIACQFIEIVLKLLWFYGITKLERFFLDLLNIKQKFG